MSNRSDAASANRKPEEGGVRTWSCFQQLPPKCKDFPGRKEKGVDTGGEHEAVDD